MAFCKEKNKFKNVQYTDIKTKAKQLKKKKDSEVLLKARFFSERLKNLKENVKINVNYRIFIPYSIFEVIFLQYISQINFPKTAYLTFPNRNKKKHFYRYSTVKAD